MTTKSRRRVGRLVGRALLSVAVLVVSLGVVLVASAWTSMGRRADGARLARMQRSPQWNGDRFDNPEPLVNDFVGSLTGWFAASRYTSPEGALAVAPVDPRRFDASPASGLRVTWFGHASTLVEIEGTRVLTDPIWSERASPIDWLGPKRWYPPPIALRDLPPIDAVVISHDHYDHLDRPTLLAMKDWKTRFIVPLGVGAHLVYWGIDEARIVELDWWERTRVGSLDVVCTPARHASGRGLLDKDAKLWAGYALIGATHRVYFSGDTGLFRAMNEIGERLGPFDVTMIETGQYHKAWPDWHIGPEQAVEAHRRVRGRVMLPVHWALLTLAYHGWTEPMERVLANATQAGVAVLTPKPGESVEPIDAAGQVRSSLAAEHTRRWWPTVPWQSGERDPIVSSQAY